MKLDHSIISEKLEKLSRSFVLCRKGRHPKGIKYPTSLQHKLLRAIDEGVPAEDAIKATGIVGSTLARWRQEEGNKISKKRSIPIRVEAPESAPHLPTSAEVVRAPVDLAPVMPRIKMPSGIIIEIPAELLGQAIISLKEIMPC